MEKILQDIGDLVSTTVEGVLHKVSGVPGSAIVLRYIKSSYQNDPIRSLLEALLVIFAIRYFLASKYSTSKQNYVQLEEYEIDELVDEWKPEPLVQPLAPSERWKLDKIPIIYGESGPKVRLTTAEEALALSPVINKSIKSVSENVPDSNNNLKDNTLYLNFLTTDVLNFNNNPIVRSKAVETIRRYGVGSCGPAGFYGNQDVHTQCENDIAAFIGAEGCILYAQAMATPSSVIPCFLKRGDVIVADKGVNISIQKGIILSRATVYWYEHNDINDLEKKLALANSKYRKGPLPRRFIITEGLFEHFGDSPDLPKIVDLKHKYKYRLILDESWSLGMLGKTGRGLPEVAGIDREEIDITIGSLANVFGSAGGFCAGVKHMVEHQRITSLAYTFSATMPAYLANTTSVVLGLFQEDGFKSDTLVNFHQKGQGVYNVLKDNTHIDIVSNPGIPFVQMVLTKEFASLQEEEIVLQNIVDRARKNGVLISRHMFVPEVEVVPVEQGLRFLVNNGLTLEEVLHGARVVNDAINDEFAN
jgi:serine palmitoyltransferase